MADFLTRLAGRTLGLVPTVQPILAPMYASGHEIMEQGYPQRVSPRMPPNEQVSIGDVHMAPGEQVSIGNVHMAQGDATFGNLDVQTEDPQEMPSQEVPLQPATQFAEQMPPLVLQGNRSSITPTQAPHTPHKMPNVQLAPGFPASLEREEAESSPDQAPTTGNTRDARRASLHPTRSMAMDVTSSPIEPRTASILIEQNKGLGLQPTEAMVVVESKGIADLSARATQAGVLPLPLVPQGNQSVEASLALPVADALPTQRPTELKTTHPQFTAYRVNQRETAPTTPELSTPESSTSAPTIQVTIGRIEVRAMPPPHPRSQPPRSGPPVMGLEEYLNQRAKGGY